MAKFDGKANPHRFSIRGQGGFWNITNIWRDGGVYQRGNTLNAVYVVTSLTGLELDFLFVDVYNILNE